MPAEVGVNQWRQVYTDFNMSAERKCDVPALLRKRACMIQGVMVLNGTLSYRSVVDFVIIPSDLQFLGHTGEEREAQLISTWW